MSGEKFYQSVYTPKGSMCANCQHWREDCSGKPFNEMRVIDNHEQNGVQIKIVRCVDFSENGDEALKPFD